jgi:GntR family transcriptional regulator, transcriptional repressor for pyruvate dehydrogenase complex
MSASKIKTAMVEQNEHHRRNLKEHRSPHSKSIESKIRRITRISISEEIAKQIMDLIASGDLTPGQRLPSERDLCEQFGASRSSLREALRCLSIVGVLNARVGEGTSLAPDGKKFLRRIMEWRLITEKHDIENLLKVRIALEGESAANTAIHGKPEDFAVLRELVARMRRVVKNEKEFAMLDLEFHIEIANASGNSLLSDLISVIRSQLAKALSRVLNAPGALSLSLAEHASILAAIERRDPVAARVAMQEHVEAGLERYRAQTAGSGQSSDGHLRRSTVHRGSQTRRLKS